MYILHEFRWNGNESKRWVEHEDFWLLLTLLSFPNRQSCTSSWRTKLVRGFNHLEKYEFVNGKDCPIYETENKKCLKPPTSDLSIHPFIIILLLPVYLCFVASHSGPLRPSRWGKFRKSTHRKITNRPQRVRMRNGDNVANPIINWTLNCIYTCIST